MADDPIRFLLDEHERLKGLLEAVAGAAAADPPDTAALVEQARALGAALALHERREEEVLFPAVAGMGPVQLVLQEHARLKGLRDALDAALAAAAAAPDAAAGAEVKRRVDEVAYCLSGHMMKEEQLVFRMAQAMLPPDRLAELGARMAALT